MIAGRVVGEEEEEGEGEGEEGQLEGHRQWCSHLTHRHQLTEGRERCVLASHLPLPQWFEVFLLLQGPGINKKVILDSLCISCVSVSFSLVPLALSRPPVRPACPSVSAGHSSAVVVELEMETPHLWPFQDSGDEKEITL